MRTLAGWCVRHRRLVLLIWAIVLVLSLGLVKSIGSDYSNSFSFPHTQSSDAIALLQALTQVQEMTLTFVPKMLVVFVVFSLTASFMGAQFTIFTQNIYAHIEHGYGE